MKLFIVNQRLVVATKILIEARNKSEAKKLAAAFVTEEITKAIKEESDGSDKAEIEDIEVTNCQPT
jgi:superfamily II DNA or RNA helicase